MSLLEVRGLARSFGAVRAVRGVDLGVAAGEIYGLVGADGAGKTTTLRMVVGLLTPAQGTTRISGLDPLTTARQAAAQVRELVGYMPQQASLYGDLTVDENLRFFSALFGLGEAAFRARRERLLEVTRLGRFVARRADALSGGMYKKLALMCALLHQPRLLVLDEPTNGVDPVSRREFWDLIGSFAHEGMAVLLSTPYMDEAARCHRVGVMHEGRLLLEGEPGALLGAFPHQVFRVSGGARDAVVALLGAHPAVLALSPAGDRMRIVVLGSATAVAAALQPLGATLHPTAPDFEDLFLARLREEA